MFIKTTGHLGYFCSASSSPLLLRGAPETARILCRNFTPKRHCDRQLRVKNLPKAATLLLEWDSNPLPFRRKVSTLPKRHHASQSPLNIIVRLFYVVL